MKIKGLAIVLAVFTFFQIFGTKTASAKEPSVEITTEIPCSISKFSLVSSLKTARLTRNSNGSDSFVPALFTSAKDSNGSLSASIGVSVADPEAAVVETIPTPQYVSPTSTVSPTVSSSVIASDNQVGLDANTIFAMVNAHRAKLGLPPFQNDANLAQIAQSRTPELQGEMYGGGGMHAGFYNRQLPYWATENMISQKSETDAVNWWLNSPVHRSAIEGNYTNASVACEGNNCAMIFTSFAPKE